MVLPMPLLQRLTQTKTANMTGFVGSLGGREQLERGMGFLDVTMLTERRLTRLGTGIWSRVVELRMMRLRYLLPLG